MMAVSSLVRTAFLALPCSGSFCSAETCDRAAPFVVQEVPAARGVRPLRLAHPECLRVGCELAAVPDPAFDHGLALARIVEILLKRELSVACILENRDAAEAIEYGLADRVLQKAPEIVRDQEPEQE